MRLLPYWQQGTITGYIDRTKASIGTLEDEVLDLCKSPMYTIEDSAECDAKIQDFKKTATINGYKSLIKQAKPKSYLCLSRKAEKRARLSKLQLSKIHSSKLSSSKRSKLLRKRRLLLSKYQKKQLRLRRKKLMTLHQERLNEKVNQQNLRMEAQKEITNESMEQIENANNVELKPPATVLSDRKKVLANEQKSNGGYFSEPEHCTNCPTKERKQKHKTKENTTVLPKRSKSETKKNNNNNAEMMCEKDASCCNLKTNNMHISQIICKSKNAKKTVKERRPRVSTKISKNKNTDEDEQYLLPSNYNVDESDKFESNNNFYEQNSDSMLVENVQMQQDEINQIQMQTQTQQHSIETQQFMQPILPPLPRIACHQHHNVATKRSRSRTKFGVRKRTKHKHSTIAFALDETLPPVTRGDVVPKWNNGWTWEGEPFQGAVFLNSDDPLVLRTCYPAMRHKEGDVIRTRDCVLLKANEDNELPYVAKVAHLWKNPADGEMMMSLLWYYRPEHTEQGRQPNDSPDEVLASRHRDHNSVACIEDKCYVLTFSEYCRYRRRLRALEEEMEDVTIVPKRVCGYNIRTVPENTNPELVMFCRRAYEFRTKRLLKMPSKQDYYVVTS